MGSADHEGFYRDCGITLSEMEIFPQGFDQEVTHHDLNVKGPPTFEVGEGSGSRKWC